jgi:predicted nucleic acid-binding protein
MSRVILDSGPLGKIVHPRPHADIANWLDGLLAAGIEIIIPEIADYEVRRELLLAGLTTSVQRLDELKEALTYSPLTTPIMLRAAELWAEARRLGRLPADPKELNGDMILAAQAESVGAVIATENVGHLALFADARHWKDISESA